MAEQDGILFEMVAYKKPVTVVPMGGIDLVAFHQMPAIGTAGLGGCSVVLIVSMHAAILGHIPPLPPHNSTDPLGHNNVRSMMGQVLNLYLHYRNQSYFPTSGTVIICAKMQGEWGLPDQLNIMQQYFQQFGHNPLIRHYNVPRSGNVKGEGTVLVQSNGSQVAPTVYIEDNPIENFPMA